MRLAFGTNLKHNVSCGLFERLVSQFTVT